MTLDLSPLIQALIGLLAAVLSGAATVLVPAVLKYLNVTDKAAQDQANAKASELIARAADAAAGEAYRIALKHGVDLSRVDMHDMPVSAAVAYVVSRVPDALKRLDITEDGVRQLVSARLGALLAGDASVSTSRVMLRPIPLPIRTPPDIAQPQPPDPPQVPDPEPEDAFAKLARPPQPEVTQPPAPAAVPSGAPNRFRVEPRISLPPAADKPA
jgi:hypothetical protein